MGNPGENYITAEEAHAHTPDWEWGEHTSAEDCEDYLTQNFSPMDVLQEGLEHAKASYIEKAGEDPKEYGFEEISITIWAPRDRG